MTGFYEQGRDMNIIITSELFRSVEKCEAVLLDEGKNIAIHRWHFQATAYSNCVL